MRYPGGKGKCFHQLINLMPPHTTYIEAYLGGGSVLRNKKPALRSIGIDIDPAVISAWKESFEDVELVEADALAYLEAFEFTGSELVYLDPPYLPSTRRKERVYRHDYTDGQHERLLKIASSLPCMVMISGYPSQMYNLHLNGWNRTEFKANSQVGLRDECVWYNFKSPSVLHDVSHLGATFRERQTIKRRRQRLYDRIEEMDPVERHELLVWMKEKFGDTRVI
ncbi:DNA adenine methylase [Duganella sp. HH105]|uniref:DNA adenine methylase n=1 Tax=Duganella sp. HH105 TaxID=1781067 RepID=UPI000877D61C|nr:DNA adenine methylase [Duganella sp. HH105]OEZ61257.1 D12 class N6 adenine-specific DNA methyltransferase [Duganella sp. HH105]